MVPLTFHFLLLVCRYTINFEYSKPIISFVNNELVSPFASCVPFNLYCFAALLKTSNALLKRSGNSSSIFLPWLLWSKEKAFLPFSIKYGVRCRFLIVTFHQIKEVFLLFLVWQLFILLWMDIEFYQPFLHLLRWLWFFFLNMFT